MKRSRSEEIGVKITEEQKHWDYLYQHGGSDPMWEDGCNLNLIRNHIVYYRRQCEDELQPGEYPAEYYDALPPEVDNKYMARVDEIRKNARSSLTVYLANEDYRYILKNLHRLSDEQKKSVCAVAVIGYAESLKTFIEKDMLVDMRRHENPERYVSSFSECRGKIEMLLGPKKVLPMGQLSLFDLFECMSCDR